MGGQHAIDDLSRSKIGKDKASPYPELFFGRRRVFLEVLQQLDDYRRGLGADGLGEGLYPGAELAVVHVGGNMWWRKGMLMLCCVIIAGESRGGVGGGRRKLFLYGSVRRR